MCQKLQKRFASMLIYDSTQIYDNIRKNILTKYFIRNNFLNSCPYINVLMPKNELQFGIFLECFKYLN